MDSKGKRLFEIIEEQLFNMIVVEEQYKPGDRLPSENELADTYNISRATLREAIRALSVQGVLEVRRGAGTFIAKDLRKFQNDFGFHRLRVRANDLFEVRTIFEPATTRLACIRATEEEMAHIGHLADVVEETANIGEDYAKADREFHKAIAEASHNEFLIKLVGIVNEAVADYFQHVEPQLAEVTVQDNRQIMDFLQARDPQGSEYAMALHIQHALRPLKSDIPEG